MYHKTVFQSNHSSRVSSATRKIDFTNARERGYDSRPSWLSTFHNIVKFETVVQQIGEVAPMASYEYYIQLFGKGNQSQSTTQTNDDNVNDEVQTENPDQETLWTQHPASDNLGLGWGKTDENETNNDANTDDNEVKEQMMKIHDKRYLQFVDIAGKLITDIISTKITKEGDMYFTNNSNFAFSSGYELFSLEHLKSGKSSMKLSNLTLRFLEYKVSAVTVRSLQGFDTVLAAYYIKSSEITHLRNKAVIVEYKMEPETTPYIALYADNEITAISYGPEDSTVVCGGLVDGSCIAYDLSEPSRLHRKYKLPWPGVTDGICLRVPSYDNSYNSCDKNREDHGSPIVWIVTVGEVASFTFQLVTMNQRGTITLFTLTETASAFGEQQDVGDYGIRPNSKIKLTRTNVISNTIPAIRSNLLAANCMVVNPTNVYQVLIATNNGSIINYTRVKQNFTGPRAYSDSNSISSEVFSIRFSPFDSNIFAVSYYFLQWI